MLFFLQTIVYYIDEILTDNVDTFFYKSTVV